MLSLDAVPAAAAALLAAAAAALVLGRPAAGGVRQRARGIDGFDVYAAARPAFARRDGVYAFGPKHCWSTKNNPMCGICLGAWLRLLLRRGREVQWASYWPRLLFVTVMAALNSALALVERALHGRRIRDALAEDWMAEHRPVFVLGHPRTGTTLLHGLLALDERQFRYCNTFCAGFPSCFLWFEAVGKALLRGVIDETRPMDNMRLDFELPQEDELATNVLSGGVSPYMPLWFMRSFRDFEPLFSFEEAAPADTAAWTSAFRLLLTKLRLRRGGGGGRLLLKSPVHTARARLLLRLFPRAQFVYVHRNPFEVFQSACHMARTTYIYTYLATPSDEDITEFILRQYEVLWQCYKRDRDEILRADGRVVEIAFEDLARDPAAALEGVYRALGWEGWEEAKAAVLRQCADLRAYERNAHAELPEDLKRVVRERWRDSFEDLGYDIQTGQRRARRG